LSGHAMRQRPLLQTLHVHMSTASPLGCRTLLDVVSMSAERLRGLHLVHVAINPHVWLPHLKTCTKLRRVCLGSLETFDDAQLAALVSALSHSTCLQLIHCAHADTAFFAALDACRHLLRLSLQGLPHSVHMERLAHHHHLRHIELIDYLGDTDAFLGGWRLELTETCPSQAPSLVLERRSTLSTLG
jgi:hypothetical protein